MRKVSKLRNVFDVNRWANFFAISELWRARHQLKVHNIRLYYNPISDRIEPLAFDRASVFYNDFRSSNDPIHITQEEFVDSLLKDAVIEEEFYKSLKELSRDIQREKFINKLLDKDKKNIR